jgi:putative nucleotidyltransferase with HDIG domain
MVRSFARLRSTRGAEIALELGFSDATATAIRNLDEHWDGSGHPEGLSGGTIPLLSRIAGLAQTVEVFLQEGGMRAALEMVRERRGSWFDPELADIVLGWEDRKSWWSMVRVCRDAESLKGLHPGDRSRPLTETDLDRVAQAFAEVIDAKSPFTYLHSRRVAEVVRLMARRLGLPANEVQKLYRAALLHDIGKLGVSNRILDKRGPLSDDEWRVMQAHPRHTLAILQRVPAFRDVARTAAHHHERLDGSGYPWGVEGEGLDRGARALAVADVYEALTATRSYRKGIPVEEAMEILRAEAGTQLDLHMVDILAQCIDDEGGAGAVGSRKWMPAQERSA